MIGIIVVGHGSFSKGFESSIELIAGKQELYVSLEFPQEMNPDTLGENIREAVETFKNEGHDVLIFTDLLGATPFKYSVEISVEHENVKVLAGTNLAMLLEATLMRHSVDNFADFANSLVATGSSQVGIFDLEALNVDDQEIDDEGGI